MTDIEDLIIRHIANPEADILRKKEINAAKDGRMSQTDCPHPMSACHQYVDHEHGREDRPTNLWQCQICKRSLMLVDAHGQTASDG